MDAFIVVLFIINSIVFDFSIMPFVIAYQDSFASVIIFGNINIINMMIIVNAIDIKLNTLPLDCSH